MKTLNNFDRLNMTEKLFTGTLNHNQNKQKKTNNFDNWKIVCSKAMRSK